MSADKPKTRRRVIFHGHVQGVFFRATTRELAQRRPIVGFVRNLPDGTVELEAEGADEDINALLGEIRTEYAGHINREEPTTLPPRNDEADFQIVA